MEGDGAISIEAAHATSNTTVGEVAWTEIPNYGRTLSGVTPWPRLGNNETNYTAGTGPSLYVSSLPFLTLVTFRSFLLPIRSFILLIFVYRKYTFYTFNSIDQSGNISVVLNLSPSLNANGDDRPLAIATQIDSQTPRTYYPIPAAAPGGEPPDWQGWVANSLVQVGWDEFWEGVWPGAHTLTVSRCICCPLAYGSSLVWDRGLMVFSRSSLGVDDRAGGGPAENTDRYA